MKHLKGSAAPYVAQSPPTRGRGLKPLMQAEMTKAIAVAPHAGAWIETLIAGKRRPSRWVAPHAGAWIETASTD